MRSVGSALTILGTILFFAAGLYQLLAAIGFFNDQWGLLGVIALLMLPPLWLFAPFVIWVVGGVFPALFFIVWFGGWIVGGGLVALGNSITARPAT